MSSKQLHVQTQFCTRVHEDGAKEASAQAPNPQRDVLGARAAGKHRNCPLLGPAQPPPLAGQAWHRPLLCDPAAWPVTWTRVGLRPVLRLGPWAVLPKR